MISDGNILRFLYFLFLIFLDRLSLNHTSANFESKKKLIFFDVLVKCQFTRKTYFFRTLYSRNYIEFLGTRGRGGVRVNKVTILSPSCSYLTLQFSVLVFLLHNRKCPILPTFDQAVFKVRRRVGGQGGEKGFLQLLFCL